MEMYSYPKQNIIVNNNSLIVTQVNSATDH